MKDVYTQWIPKNVLLRCQVVSSYISFDCCFPSSALSKQQNFLQCTVIKRYFSFFLLFSLFVWIPLIFLTFMLACVCVRILCLVILCHFFLYTYLQAFAFVCQVGIVYLPPFSFTYISNSHTYTTTDAHTSHFQHYIFIFILHSPPSVAFFVLQIESSRLLFVVAASSFVPISSCSFVFSLPLSLLMCFLQTLLFLLCFQCCIFLLDFYIFSFTKFFFCSWIYLS